jgi:hypothetical protein
MLHLPIKIGLYVPSTNYETKIPPAAFIGRVTRVQRLFAGWFGGYTALNYASGGWLTDDRHLIKDDIVIVNSNTDIETIRKQSLHLFSYVSECFITWEQYSISLEVNGQLSIIDSDDTIENFLAYYPQFRPELSADLQEENYNGKL